MTCIKIIRKLVALLFWITLPRYCNFRRRLKLKLPSEPTISREYPTDGHTETDPPSQRKGCCTEWRGRQLQSKGDSTIMHHRH